MVHISEQLNTLTPKCQGGPVGPLSSVFFTFSDIWGLIGCIALFEAHTKVILALVPIMKKSSRKKPNCWIPTI
jgi:hypothetical protein